MTANRWRTLLLGCLLYLASQTLCDPIPSSSLPLLAPSSAQAVPSVKPIEPPPTPDSDANKYFHEPGGDDLLHHYDIRYFQKIVTDEERRDTLRHLIRAYLLTFEYLGVETWIAHGTLLAWYWNGKILPWDWDLDTQVTDEGLKILGKQYNQTFYDYDQDDGSPTRRYFLDVNSWAWQRVRGDGANIIDARFISVDNGLFIDITGLSEAHPDSDPGIIMCKNDHKYALTDIFPLRETHFEGVKAKVPYAYIPILIKEYSEQALVRTEFHDHEWHSSSREWLKKSKDQNKVDSAGQESDENAKMDDET